MPVKVPDGNRVVLSILRSPVHRLLSGMVIELRYTGRRSGRQYVLPVQYARDDQLLVVVPQGAKSTWWRNFMTAQPVKVRLQGRLRDATARVVHPDDPAWGREKSRYERRWRRLSGRVAGPLVEIAVGTGDGSPRRTDQIGRRRE